MKKEKGQSFLSMTVDISEKIISYIAMVFLVIMILIVTMTVFTRYFLNYTYRWSDEIALLMMIWFGFIGIALGVKSSIHLSIEYFMSLIPDRYQVWIYQIENILVGLFGWYMMRFGIQLYNSTRMTRLPATQWSRGLLFIMLPVSGGFVLVYSIAKMFNIIKRKPKTITPGIDEQQDKGVN